MLYQRSSFGCTIFKSVAHDGRPVMIAVGGQGGGHMTSEVWDFTKDGTSWEESRFTLVLHYWHLIYHLRRGQVKPSDSFDHVSSKLLE